MPEQEFTPGDQYPAARQSADMVRLIERNTGYRPEFIELVKRVVAPTATDDELALFLYHARRMGLDPMAGQIYFSKFRSRIDKGGKTQFKDRIVIITGIDGYRSTAEQTGEYDGQDEATYVYYEGNKDHKHPDEARVAVYRKGVSRPFIGIARWDEYYPKTSGKQEIWNARPHGQLAKCAEALAFRRGFPKNLSGVYVAEEMHQAAQDIMEERTAQAEIKNITPPPPPEPEPEEESVPMISEEDMAAIIDAATQNADYAPMIKKFVTDLDAESIEFLTAEQGEQLKIRIGLAQASEGKKDKPTQKRLG